jgi:hypothetical protein
MRTCRIRTTSKATETAASLSPHSACSFGRNVTFESSSPEDFAITAKMVVAAVAGMR